MKTVLLLSLVLVVCVGGLLVWGPRERVEPPRGFDEAQVPEAPADLDAWLAERESGVPALRPDSAKRIVWAGEAGQVTPLSVVYLHGFSASSEEIRPVPDAVAEALGANLYFGRLSGHGRDGAAMAEPGAGDWIHDTAEALAIGRRIGERVLVIGTSTGGTLATIAAADPAMSERMAGVVLVSPLYRIADPAAGLLTLPFARHWAPLIAGAERSFSPVNAAHAAHWTSSYPTVAVVPLAALVSHVAKIDVGTIDVPALFIYSRADTVVSAEATDVAHDAWGAPASRLLIEADGAGDPANHVIVGDILSPERTDAVSGQIADWASGL
ncbi:alpha/beta hydrolase [Tropicimonas sediminicola]|uniref:Esterase/lipase n=1 Tax=Tropicimonas sediminicola TaxID=1031541 RepID=A0A239KFA4_9RHOB|nr:alpha/beta fold hydrolase [Tropicimonas sediminicola]SNT16745.1 Esterase/lipase [Tropicimonas sediminicola]